MAAQQGHPTTPPSGNAAANDTEKAAGNRGR